jgi:hypothetical protein
MQQRGLPDYLKYMTLQCSFLKYSLMERYLYIKRVATKYPE